MQETIQKLREKPESVKRNILHLIVLVAGILLVLLWVFTLNRNINDDDVRDGMASDIDAFSPLTDDLVDGYSQIGNAGITVE